MSQLGSSPQSYLRGVQARIGASCARNSVRTTEHPFPPVASLPGHTFDLDVVAELLDLLARPGAESMPGGIEAAGRHRQAQRGVQLLAGCQAGAERGEHRVTGTARLQ